MIGGASEAESKEGFTVEVEVEAARLMAEISESSKLVL